MTSPSTDQFIEKGIAEQIKCTICLGVPLSPHAVNTLIAKSVLLHPSKSEM